MHTRIRPTARFAFFGAVTAVAALALVGCAPAEGAKQDDSKAVSLAVHGSFVDGKAFEKAASKATGYDVSLVVAGDGGELTNKLVLTKGAPIADAFYGVDNYYASRLIDNDVIDPVSTEKLPERAQALAAELAPHDVKQGETPLVPIDLGATCMNVDNDWFAEHKIAVPKTFEDLADPSYKDLTALIDPTASSTGASFMVATIAKYGEDGFTDYWKDLEANGARVVQGWTEAYNTEFTGVSDTGTRPIVLSYSTSPAFTVSEDGTSSKTSAMLDTCSTQIEYAGVTKGASNPDGARAVIEYLLSNEFQREIPDQMYMYPVDETVALPESWAKFAPLPEAGTTYDLGPAQVQAGLEGWLRKLGDAVGL